MPHLLHMSVTFFCIFIQPFRKFHMQYILLANWQDSYIHTHQIWVQMFHFPIGSYQCPSMSSKLVDMCSSREVDSEDYNFKNKGALFHLLCSHDIEFWSLRMFIILKFHILISNLLDFLYCVLSWSHSNWEDHSSGFLKFHECMTNMMRICLLLALPYRISLWKL